MFASLAFSSGTNTVVIPFSLSPLTSGSIPLTFLKLPSRDNSPRKAVLLSSGISIPCSFKIPTAIGRS